MEKENAPNPCCKDGDCPKCRARRQLQKAGIQNPTANQIAAWYLGWWELKELYLAKVKMHLEANNEDLERKRANHNSALISIGRSLALIEKFETILNNNK